MSTTTARPTRAGPASGSRFGYTCSECGWTAVKWVGRCGECQAWGTLTEDSPSAGPRTVATSPRHGPAEPITEIDLTTAHARPTGVGELDRVLGGGLVPGAVILLAGEPGVGKSTLLLEVAARVADDGRVVLYVTAEESVGQVRLRAERTGSLSPGLLLAAESDLGAVLGHLERHDPAMLVVDSVQTVASAQVDGAAGGVNQVREVAAALIAAAKGRGIPAVLVGHLTKDGSVAGPRTLEHLVDVVCQVEGDLHSRLRLLRATKNRYGPTDEVGCFELTEHGVLELADPSALFLSGSLHDGTCVTVTLEGRRPLATEVQALVASTMLTNPRRTTSGVDSSRLAMVLAVLQRRAGISLADRDVYVSTVGGARMVEPAVDLAVALAVAGSAEGITPNHRLVAFGEVGLAGEIRPVAGLPRRLSEARRLGFTTAIVPKPMVEPGEVSIDLHAAEDIRQALDLARERGHPTGS